MFDPSAYSACVCLTCIHTLLFFEESCTLQFSLDILVGVIVRWVVSIDEPSKVPIFSVGYFYCDHVTGLFPICFTYLLTFS